MCPDLSFDFAIRLYPNEGKPFLAYYTYESLSQARVWAINLVGDGLDRKKAEILCGPKGMSIEHYDRIVETVYPTPIKKGKGPCRSLRWLKTKDDVKREVCRREEMDWEQTLTKKELVDLHWECSCSRYLLRMTLIDIKNALHDESVVDKPVAKEIAARIDAVLEMTK